MTLNEFRELTKDMPGELQMAYLNSNYDMRAGYAYEFWGLDPTDVQIIKDKKEAGYREVCDSRLQFPFLAVPGCTL